MIMTITHATINGLSPRMAKLNFAFLPIFFPPLCVRATKGYTLDPKRQHIPFALVKYICLALLGFCSGVASSHFSKSGKMTAAGFLLIRSRMRSGPGNIMMCFCFLLLALEKSPLSRAMKYKVA